MDEFYSIAGWLPSSCLSVEGQDEGQGEMAIDVFQKVGCLGDQRGCHGC